MYFYFFMSAIIGFFCGYGIAVMFDGIKGLIITVMIGALYVLSAIYQEKQQNREVTAKS